MQVKEFLKKLDFEIEKNDLDFIKNETDKILFLLKNEIKRRKVKADIFVGGSLAKGTIVKSNWYDIDIFVRFEKKNDKISYLLEEIINGIKKEKKMNIERVHGSRDYFKVKKGVEGKEVEFEIIPVLKIKKPKEAENVTDLSYFHVNYVKNEIRKNKKLKKDIPMAKAFCGANKVYGAEGYVQGLSGYAVECLVINYGSFEKMAKEIINVKERVILDPKKQYKNKNEIFLELNEAKMQSPIVLIDPTWKERNVLAALHRETFIRLQEALKDLIRKPRKELFELRKMDELGLKNRAKKQSSEFLKVVMKTDRQEGDIAGTKLKKFSKYLKNEMSKYFEIKESEFEYYGKKEATIYLILKSKKEIINRGPPVEMKKDAIHFRKMNKNIFDKDRRLYSKIKINFTGKDFVKRLITEQKDKIRDMGINWIEV